MNCPNCDAPVEREDEHREWKPKPYDRFSCKPKQPEVIDLMEALRKSLSGLAPAKKGDDK